MELYARVYHSPFSGWQWAITDEHHKTVASGHAKTELNAATDCNMEFISRVDSIPVGNALTEVFKPDNPRSKARAQVDVWRHNGKVLGMASYAEPRSRAMILREYANTTLAWADMRRTAADLLG